MTAPLTRDQQIELMKAAKERHADVVTRWKSDPAVRKQLREPSEKQRKSQYQESDIRLQRCG